MEEPVKKRSQENLSERVENEQVSEAWRSKQKWRKKN